MHKFQLLFAFMFILFLTRGECLFSQSWIRINQLGYTPDSKKVAVIVSKNQLRIEGFALYNALTDAIVFNSKLIKSFENWGPFQSSFRLDFTSFVLPGTYYIQSGEIKSPVFRISKYVYDGTADFLLKYMRQQRCGYNPFLHDSCHTRDGYVIYNPANDSSHIDVTGGWHDATDYLQYTSTSANAVYQMLIAWQANPAAFGDAYLANGEPGKNGIPDILDEARWGLDWLVKMNPDSGQMYNQIADDRDHIGFRLPNKDSANYGKGHERPVYFCTGEPQGVFKYKNRATGISSTAGKFTSAFALGSQIFGKWDPEFSRLLAEKSKAAFDFGLARPGACQTAPCTAPYFYEEDNYTDDMELAAAILFQITGERKYLDKAIEFGRQELFTPWMGADTARHYQWYPFLNMGHWEISRSADKPLSEEFLNYWKKGIDLVYQRGSNNPFMNGIPFIWCSNNLTVAFITQCHLYAGSSGDHTYDELESSLRDWLFGCNPWGTTMIVGMPQNGDYPSDPHSSLSVLYHYKLDGGLVDGPVYNSIYKNLKGIFLAGGDEYEAFQSNAAVYHDDYADYSTNEPTMDGTADLTYYLSAMQAEAHSNNDVSSGLEMDHGAIVRGSENEKVISLVFTGDASIFMPPFEWYNDSIAFWSRQYGLQLVNFTPGTSSNQDWTYPGLGHQ
jgi:endoglucanase